MAKTWDSFIPLMAPHLPGCPIPSMKAYLASTTADFFARTYLWRDVIDAIYVAPNQIEYDLDSEALVEDVLSVWYETRELERTQIQYIPSEQRDKTGDPERYWVQADRSIRIHPTPTQRTKLSVIAVLKPSRDGTGVEDWIYETWLDVLVSGAVAQLADLPDKEWSDSNVARSHKEIYERGITRARIRDNRGVRLTMTMRPAA
jgi:hypothetical protein